MIKFKRFLAALGIVAVTAGVIVIVEASPAAASYSACPSGRACAYIDAGGNGSMLQIGIGGGGCSNMPFGWRNNISSAVNKFNGVLISFFDNLGCSNQIGQGAVVLQPGQTVDFGFWHNDDVESYWIEVL